jgi:short-subunit dehydrogenase
LRHHERIHVSLVMPGVVSTPFAQHVLGEKVVPISGGMPIQTAEDVAAQLVALIENPVDELLTNPGMLDMLRRSEGR